jgi:hypothetical protein
LLNYKYWMETLDESRQLKPKSSIQREIIFSST